MLLVEDNPGDAHLTSDRLMDASVEFVVTIEGTLRAAQGRLAEAEFDVVILDLRLPDCEGVETISRLRAVRPIVPFIVVSGELTPELNRSALAEGADEVISKHEANSRLFALSVLHIIERNQSAEHRHRLERILDASPDAVVVLEGHGRLQYANDAAQRLLGSARSELEQGLLERPPGPGEAIELRLPAEGAPERIAELRVVEVDWKGRQSSFATLRDITERKALEMQLVVSDRLAAIGTLAAGVAHEINNPLAAIVSNLAFVSEQLSALHARAPLPAELQEGVVEAQEAATRVRQIVRDLKVFSHPGDDARDSVDLHKVLESTLRMAQHELRYGTQVVREFGGGPMMVGGNESRLGQVCLNLVVNAAQAMKGRTGAQNVLRIGTRIDGAGRVRVFVSDTGPGISPQVQKQLFTPFFTTKAPGEGTGLGLAISQRIIRELGGELWFETSAAGTTFWVALRPVRNESDPVAPAQAAEVRPARVRVLCIDDDASILRTLKRTLEPEHDVETSSTARAALERLERGEAFDVVLCDMSMPQMNGVAFYEHVCRMGRGLERRIVFLTGGAVSSDARAFLDTTKNRCVEKPFERRALTAIIRQASSPSTQGAFPFPDNHRPSS